MHIFSNSKATTNESSFMAIRQCDKFSSRNKKATYLSFSWSSVPGKGWTAKWIEVMSSVIPYKFQSRSKLI